MSFCFIYEFIFDKFFGRRGVKEKEKGCEKGVWGVGGGKNGGGEKCGNSGQKSKRLSDQFVKWDRFV